MGDYFPTDFQNCARCVKDLKDNKHKTNSLHLGRNYVRIFVLGHYLFLTARYSEEITSADKYPSMFSRRMEAIVFISRRLIPGCPAELLDIAHVIVKTVKSIEGTILE